MMGGWDYSHYVDTWSPEDGVIGGLDVKNTELCDDVEWIREGWELDCVGGISFAPVESVKE